MQMNGQSLQEEQEETGEQEKEEGEEAQEKEEGEATSMEQEEGEAEGQQDSESKEDVGKPASATESETAAPVVNDWTAVWDEKHQAYYYHSPTQNITTWELPQGMAVPTAKAGQAPSSSTTPTTPFDPSQPLPVNKSNSLLLFNGGRSLLGVYAYSMTIANVSLL